MFIVNLRCCEGFQEEEMTEIPSHVICYPCNTGENDRRTIQQK